MPKVIIKKAERPVGRPRVDPAYKRVPMGVSIDPQVKKELTRMAEKKGVSISVVVNGILEDAVL